jgi:hypothetical protein
MYSLRENVLYIIIFISTHYFSRDSTLGSVIGALLKNIITFTLLYVTTCTFTIHHQSSNTIMVIMSDEPKIASRCTFGWFLIFFLLFAMQILGQSAKQTRF